MRNRAGWLQVFLLVIVILFCCCDAAWAMIIHIERADGPTLHLDVEASDTIEAVKAKIQDLISLAPEDQCLSYNNIALADGHSLSDYNIPQNATITLAPVNQAPTATVQAITGTETVGATLTGHYTYTDAENNAEGTSTFKWYRSTAADGTGKAAIAGAVGSTYVLQPADAGKYISFEVTPVASAGTTPGSAVESARTGAVVNAAGKTLTADTTNNDVDHDIEVTFVGDATFEGAITGVSFNGNALAGGQYTVASGKVTLKPGVAGNTFLRTPATGNVVITATGYNSSAAAQTLTAGAAATLTVSQQPVPGAASGNAFATQPIITLKDQYGNTCSDGPSASATIAAAAAAGTGSWTIGGTTVKVAVSGVADFSANALTCTLAAAGTGRVTFTKQGSAVSVDSNPFTIPAANATISPASATFDKYAGSAQSVNLPVTVNANGNSLIAIKNGANPLVIDTDYTVASSVYTLKKEYLQTLAVGTVILTFDFSAVTDPTLSLTIADSTPTGGGGSSSSSNNATVTGTPGANIMVNGKTENAGTATTSTVDGQSVLTIAVDPIKLEQKLAAEGNHSVVTVPVTVGTDVVVSELNGQMVQNMGTREAVLEVRTPTAAYTLPAQQINIEAISDQIGNNVQLQDIKVHIEIAKPDAQTANAVQISAEKGQLTVVAPPVDFNITCSCGAKTVSVSQFNAFVERTIAIPDGVDPTKITTGVVLNNDGTLTPVPTRIVETNGKYYAKINSLTNSTYSVIWHPVEFSDAAKHWAEEAVNDMGSRMVISGVGKGRFEPDRDITRAEYAAIIVRALGLKPKTGNSVFKDVKASDWYCGYIQTAYEYDIISGYSSGKFGPKDRITREQAMNMAARAMKTTGLKAVPSNTEIETMLASLGARGRLSGWAKAGIAACVKAGIVTKATGKLYAVAGNATRAEVAVLIRNLLKKSNLV